MTITSTGPSGFHLKPLVAVFALTAIAAGVLAIVQVTGTDSLQRTPAPVEASTEVAEPYTGPSGLSEALADGKLDAGLASQKVSRSPGANRFLRSSRSRGTATFTTRWSRGSSTWTSRRETLLCSTFSSLRRPSLPAGRPKRLLQASSTPD